jgi:hypothetical protein
MYDRRRATGSKTIVLAGYWPKPNKDPVGELRCSEGQRRQGCGSSLLGAWIGQPRDDPYQVDCGGNQDVLERRFRHASGARSAPVERPHTLGKRAFNAGPLRVLFLELTCPLALTRGLEHLLCLPCGQVAVWLSQSTLKAPLS